LVKKIYDLSYTNTTRQLQKIFLNLSDLLQNPDMSITLDSDTYKSIVKGTQSVADAVNSGNVKFDGNIKDLESFVSLFDPLLLYEESTKYE
jgi:alkyl sulfatase BDS1-like metallo-beta-lactamase superfamily hydrolase